MSFRFSASGIFPLFLQFVVVHLPLLIIIRSQSTYPTAPAKHGPTQPPPHAQPPSAAPTSSGAPGDTENGILADPIVNCGIDSLSLEIRTLRPFGGRVFVKGFSQEQQCQLLGNHSAHAFTFGVRIEQCGLRRSREINGVSVSATVVVSFHPIFITKLDRAFRLHCFYTEQSHRTVSQQLEVGQLSTAASIRAEHKLPSCRYDILWLNAHGQSIRFARIGDTVFHRWSCHSDHPGMYCMRVHSCTVSDGQGGDAVEVLDRRGCGVDPLLLRDLDYADDLSAGQNASVFKFADKPTLHFNCQIELAMRDSTRGCAPNRPKCGAQPQSAERSHQSPNPFFHSDEHPQRQTKLDEAQGWEAEDEEDDEADGTPFVTRPTASGSASSEAAARVSVVTIPLHAARFQLHPNGSTARVQATTTSAGIQAPTEGQTRVVPSPLVRERQSSEAAVAHAASLPNELPAPGSDLYEDEVDELGTAGTRKRKKAAAAARKRRDPVPASRHRRVAADFDLPERSLVVIDVDEHTLAQQPPLWRVLNYSLSPVVPPARPQQQQCHFLAGPAPSWALLLMLFVLLVMLSLVSLLLFTASRGWHRKAHIREGGIIEDEKVWKNGNGRTEEEEKGRDEILEKKNVITVRF